MNNFQTINNGYSKFKHIIECQSIKKRKVKNLILKVFIFIIKQQTLKMKKFLDLKRSIVDSKNQPTLIQTYLDTIRSSCYKLATPNISPRPSNQESPSQNKANVNTQNVDKNIQKSASQRQKQSNQGVVISNQKGSNSKNKRMTYRCNISQMMQSTNQSDSNETIIKNIQHTPRSAQLSPKVTPSQIQQIFQTLQSNCKTQSKEGQAYKSQKQIIQAIIENLNMLNKKKQYQQSIKLIKNIIEGMGQTLNDNLAHHSQVKNVDYIMQTPEQDIRSSRQNSHFKSCMQAEEKSTIENSIGNNKDFAMKIDWNKSSVDSHKNIDKKIKILSKQSNNQNIKSNPIDEPIVIKYTVHKNPFKSSEGSSIYIQDSQNQQLFQQQYQDGEETTQQQLDDTMKSQDLNKWKQDQLYQISQHEQDEQDPKSSLNSSIVPQETIQFKKILYMLDSGSTSKKIPELQFKQVDLNRKVSQNNSHGQSKSSFNSSNRSIKKLFATEVEEHQNHHSGDCQHQYSNIDENSPWANTNTNKSSLRSSNSHARSNSNSSLKFKNSKLIKETEVNEFNKSDKSKDLRNIVDMLNKKYNRTIKLTKFNNQFQN